MTGRLLAEQGHTVVLHARNETRAEDARRALPKAEAVLVGDVSTLATMRDVAEQANAISRFDAVIHNVGVGYREPCRVSTVDNLSQLWAVNVLAPYILTALLAKPERLIYLSSGMHLDGDPSFDDPQWSHRSWNGAQAYSDTKLHDVLLAFGVARLWSDVFVNVVSPGWVRTRMGGQGANDDLEQAHLTQAWLSVSEESQTRTSGGYLYHKKPGRVNPVARDGELQDQVLEYCRELSGIRLDG